MWTRRATLLWALTFLAAMWFDVSWCMFTTFTSLSSADTWVNALLAATLLSMPALALQSPRPQAAVITLFTIWLECNLMYGRTYFAAIPLSSYMLAGNLRDFTGSVADSLRAGDLLFLAIDIAAWAIAARRHASRKRYFGRWSLYTGALALVSLTLLAFRGGPSKAWESLADANHHTCRVPMSLIVGSLLNDATDTLAPLSDEERREVNEWLAVHPAPAALPDSVKAPRSLVFIFCESLESWPIGLSLEGKEITPCLNRLVADSTNLYAPGLESQVGAGRSIDGQLIDLTGLLPLSTGVYAMDCIDNEYPSIIHAMKQADPSVRASLLTVDKPIVWNQARVAAAFGVDTIISRDDWTEGEVTGSRHKLGDRPFVRQAIGKMRRGEIFPVGSHAYVQMVTYSGHNPFVLPDTLDNLRLRGSYHTTIRNYLTMAHYTDAALGELVAYLRSRPDADDIMIVITGDHEGLAAYRGEAHSRHPWVSLHSRVPLIVVNPPVGGGRHDLVGGQVDIYPTVLQLMGLGGKYPWNGLGTSILDPAFPGDTLRRRDARRVSNLILRHNLLQK